MNETENEIKVKFVMRGADLTQGLPFTVLVQQGPAIQKPESLVYLSSQYKKILAY